MKNVEGREEECGGPGGGVWRAGRRSVGEPLDTGLGTSCFHTKNVSSVDKIVFAVSVLVFKFSRKSRTEIE